MAILFTTKYLKLMNSLTEAYRAREINLHQELATTINNFLETLKLSKERMIALRKAIHAEEMEIMPTRRIMTYITCVTDGENDEFYISYKEKLILLGLIEKLIQDGDTATKD